MKRFASSLCVLGGASLLLIWFVEPAASVPRQTTHILPTSPLDQVAPVVAEVDAQVDRLRSRLTTPPSPPVPSRDPFDFGHLPQIARPQPLVAPPPLAIQRPAPILPLLIAIVSNDGGDEDPQRAAVSSGDEVVVAKKGDTIAGFVVGEISVDAVQLVETSSGLSYRISLSGR